MAKKAQQFLVATDSRIPLTAALSTGFAAGKISAEILATRKKELTSLVSEAAKTFGFQSRTTLSGAFDVSAGLLSFALAHSTGGDTLPEEWAERLVTHNWKDLAKEAITLVRNVKEKDAAYIYLFDNDKDPRILRDHLRDFALRRDSQQQWVGYNGFLEYQKGRQQLQTSDMLIRWMIKSLVRRPLFWMKDAGEGPICADETLNTLLFRTCAGLGYGQKDIILTEKDFRQARTEYEAKPAAWIKQGEQRFKDLQKSLPENLRPAIDGDWFQNLFKKGPPKVKQWESEDLPGITGLYYYQTYL